jgi:hypothetical protein
MFLNILSLHCFLEMAVLVSRKYCGVLKIRPKGIPLAFFFPDIRSFSTALHFLTDSGSIALRGSSVGLTR